jgi:hypothetical protein
MRIDSFLAKVVTVYMGYGESMSEFPLQKENGKLADDVIVYNESDSFGDIDTSALGAILFYHESTSQNVKAYPFDKNQMTFPIEGETVIIFKIENNHYWLPYSRTIYPNFRELYSISKLTEEKEVDEISPEKSKNYGRLKKTGITNTANSNQKKQTTQNYKVNTKPKFLKPYVGDTIITGRTGQSIRFSEFFLTEDGKTSSPSIFISNKKSNDSENKKIGELIEEDINKDGSSIYIVSEKVKIPFDYKNVSKERIAFKDFPSDDSFKGNQIYINSDQVILSAKSKEFIIFGKGNTGVVTDANFSVDAKKEVYIHNESNIILHTKGSNQIFLNSENGKIYLGKNKGEGAAGADVQKMVLGGELVKILQDLIDEVTKMWFLTPAGGSKKQPQNFPQFQAIKNRLDVILSKSNYLSK